MEASDHVFDHVADAELFLGGEDFEGPGFVEEDGGVDAVSGYRQLLYLRIESGEGGWQRGRTKRNAEAGIEDNSRHRCSWLRC